MVSGTQFKSYSIIWSKWRKWHKSSKNVFSSFLNLKIEKLIKKK